MNDATLLPELLRRESRTYLQYIRESFPWAMGKGETLRAQLMALAEAEKAEVTRLGRMLQRRRIALPFLGAFPTSFTTSNYVSAAYLLPRLIADHRQKIADLERDLAVVSDSEMRQQLEAYRDLKHKHLQDLETLRGANKAA